MLPTCHPWRVHEKLTEALDRGSCAGYGRRGLQFSTIGTPAALGSGLDARRSFARDFQHELANKGFAARVVLQGLEQNALRIEASGLTPESIYSLVTSPEIEQSARSIGFKTIVFAKRTRGRWDYDVQRESMLWQPALF